MYRDVNEHIIANALIEGVISTDMSASVEGTAIATEVDGQPRCSK